jgi:Rieske Fe-S protein
MTELTRRSALTGAAVALVGAVAGFLYGRSSDAAKATGGGSYSGYSATTSGKRLTSLAALPDGGGVITSGVVVTRAGAQVHAFSARCTHLGCTVGSVAKGKIYCPCHGSVFNAATGAVVQGPATSPLPPVQVVVKDGGVYSA